MDLQSLNAHALRDAWTQAQQELTDLPDFDAVLKLAADQGKPPEVAQTDAGMVREIYITLPGLREGRTRLDPATVDRMLLNDHVNFCFAIKTAPLIARFRDRRTWRFVCSDEKLATIAHYGLKRFLFYSIPEMVTSLRYGAAFMEVVWKLMTAGDLGIPVEEGIPPETVVWVPEPVTAIHPGSIVEILYTKATKDKPREFDGFKCLRSDGRVVTVDRERAFILTHNKRFHNLWGETLLQPVYIAWYFYEQISRASVRYTERIGQPVVIVHYPASEKVDYNGEKIPAAQYAMILAQNASKYTALAMPSDAHVNGSTSAPKWRIEFMAEALSGSAGTLFNDALAHLEGQISRGLILGDRVATQDGKYGSYALAQTHLAATDQDTETRLLEMIMQLERYMLPKFVRWNSTNPFAHLMVETEGLDASERSLMLSMFAQIAQSHPQAGELDLRSMAESVGVPYKSEEAIANEKAEKKKEQQDMFKLKAAANPPPAPGQKDTTADQDGKPVARATNLSWERALEPWLVLHTTDTSWTYEVPHGDISTFVETYLATRASI